MNEFDGNELRDALGGESRATFGDLRRRLEADRPGPCEALAAEVTALATGSREPDAEKHLAECARCRDRADASREVWRILSWPESKAGFGGLTAGLRAPFPLRAARVAAAALLAVAAAFAFAHTAEVRSQGLANRLERDGLSLKAIADLDTERAARMLIEIGGPEAEALLVGMMGRREELDAVIAPALAGRPVGPLHPAELVRHWRPDLLPALIDAAPPGSASVIVPALFNPALAARATRALERLPRMEAEAAVEFAGLGATPEEAGKLAERGVALAGALAAVWRSPDHRTRCFWRGVAGENRLEFLLAAANLPVFREDAFRFLDLLPEDVVAAACRDALDDPDLAAGAARAAARLSDRTLIAALKRAAKQPPPGIGAAGYELNDGPLISVKTESFESVCLYAIDRLTKAD